MYYVYLYINLVDDRRKFTLVNIKKAKSLNNIEGIIVGKAIYDGDIKLEELVKEDA